MEYKVEGTRPRGRPKKTWREIVEKDCRARGLNTEDAMCRSPGQFPQSRKTVVCVCVDEFLYYLSL